MYAYSRIKLWSVNGWVLTVETEWHVCGLVNNNEKPNRSLWKCNIYKAAKVVSKRLIHLPFHKYLSVKNNINLFDSTANECAAPNFVWRSIVWPFLGSLSFNPFGWLWLLFIQCPVILSKCSWYYQSINDISLATKQTINQYNIRDSSLQPQITFDSHHCNHR